jgi:hypothetical protein
MNDSRQSSGKASDATEQSEEGRDITDNFVFSKAVEPIRRNLQQNSNETEESD